MRPVLPAVLALFLVHGAHAQALLSPAEVESATGIKGVKEVPKNPSKGAAGAQNFADASGNLVLTVMDEPLSILPAWKRRYPKCEPVATLGADGCAAKVDPTFGFMLGYVYFSKGNRAIWLQQMGNRPGAAREPNVDRPAMLQLAQALYGKL